MTKTITLNLTLEELKQIDKYVELNDETRPLFDKIKNAYPKPQTLFDVIRNLGYSYDCCYEIVDAVEKFQKPKEPEKWDVVRESLKWCKENPEKSVEDYLTSQERGNPIHKEVENEIEKLQEKNWYVDTKTNLKPHWEPKLQTPEKVADGLKEAFREAVKQGIVSSVDKPKPMNEVLDRLENKYENDDVDDVVSRWLKKWEENPPDFLRFQLGKTLEQIITRWWCDTFTGPHEKWSMEECIDDLIDQIELFLPRSQSHEGTQNIDTVVAVEAHNELLQKIKSKLRNKKDT